MTELHPSADELSAACYWELILPDFEPPQLKFLHSYLRQMSLHELTDFFDYAAEYNEHHRFTDSTHAAKFVSSCIKRAKQARGDYDKPAPEQQNGEIQAH